MKQEECVRVLLEHGVKATSNRIVVLKELALSPRPLTLTELEMKILSIDKSGIFRTLMLFKAHHLAHAIEDGSGSMRYELCHSHATMWTTTCTSTFSVNVVNVHFVSTVFLCLRSACLLAIRQPRPAIL